MDITTTTDDSNMLQLLEYDSIPSAINLDDQNTPIIEMVLFVSYFHQICLLLTPSMSILNMVFLLQQYVLDLEFHLFKADNWNRKMYWYIIEISLENYISPQLHVVTLNTLRSCVFQAQMDVF